jgi:hypothetical protein
VRILKSIPIVVMKEGVKESSLKRSRQQDLPTPESPMRSSLIYGDSRAGQHLFEAFEGARLLRRWPLDSTASRSHKRTAQERVDIQGNHSSSFPPSQLMCAE